MDPVEAATHLMFICGEGRVHFMPVASTCVSVGDDGVQLITVVDGEPMGEMLKPGSKVRAVGPREMVAELAKLA